MKNIPNILSAFRICLVPVFVIVYFYDDEGANIGAAAVYALASMTDVLDGYLARKNNWQSNLGRVLDPLGDKLMVLAVLTCLTIDRLISPWVLALLVIKETLMLAGGLVIGRKHKMDMPASNILGKAATAIMFVVCAALLIFPAISRPWVDAMTTTALVVAFAALGSYVITFKTVVQNAKQNGGH